MEPSVQVALITSIAAVAVAFVNAWRPQARALAESQAEVDRLRRRVIELGGEPDAR